MHSGDDRPRRVIDLEMGTGKKSKKVQKKYRGLSDPFAHLGSRNHSLSDSRRWTDRYTNYLLTMDVTTRLFWPPTVNDTGRVTYKVGCRSSEDDLEACALSMAKNCRWKARKFR